MDPLPPPPNAHVSIESEVPLDKIDVPALDLDLLIKMEPSLRSILAPIKHELSFVDLLLPGESLPRYAPRSRVTRGDWAGDLVRWDIATKIRKWDAKAVMKGFAVPKSDGSSARFILDASSLNKAMQPPPHFRLPTLAEMRPIIFGFSFGQITDLRHCFYQFPVASEVALFFCLHAGDATLSFKRMAMGWSWAPSIAQSVAMAYLAPIGAAGLAIYDDFLIMDHSVEQCAASTTLLRSRISMCLGTIHPKKSASCPSPKFTYCGIEWNLSTKCHRLDPKMVSRWTPWLKVICQGRALPLRYYWIALGVSTYVQRSLLFAPSSLNNLFNWAALTAARLARGILTWNSVVVPWTSAVVELGFITGHLIRNKWVQFHLSPPASLSLYTDSSLKGWAWLLHNNQDGHCLMGFRGAWTPGPHINVLELLTVWKAIRWLCPRLPGLTWHLMCDNSTVVHQIRRGRTSNFVANRILSDLAYVLQRTKSQIRPTWVSTHDQRADEHTRLNLGPSSHPQPFGDIPFSVPLLAPSWPLLLWPHVTELRNLASTSLDVPLGILPTGV